MKKEFFKGFWHLFKGYWQGEEKWRARGLLAVVVLLTLGGVFISVLINQWYNTFYNVLQEYKYEEFWPLIGQFTVLAFIYIAFAVYAIYLRQMLQLKWRTWMTEKYLDRWMQRQTYYRMQVEGDQADNPDQRISEDINQFVSLTLQLALGFLKQAAMLGAFIVILWNLSGMLTVPVGSQEFTIYGYMVWLSVIYALAGTLLTHKVGKKLIGLNYDQQRYEADFRFSMMRVRENSESIAFYRGEVPEQKVFSGRFREVIKNYWSLMRREKSLTWFTSSYSQLAIIMPLLMAAPRYFSGAIQLGGLMQISSAFGNVQDSLSFFVNSYSSIAQWTAVVKRLTSFAEHMESAGNVKEGTTLLSGKEFSMEGFSIDLPAEKQQGLVQNLRLSVGRGEHLLVTGPSGAGKSTFLRAAAQIWPYCRGTLSFPEGELRMFLPQKPYLPLGRLKKAICYPEVEEFYCEQQILEVLDKCRLSKLSQNLEQEEDWSHVLSLGEQQRLAFARILLAKPQWAFLDEASSAMDEELEAYMYRLLQTELPDTAIISVGHRSSLFAYHQKKLHIAGDGSWDITALSWQ